MLCTDFMIYLNQLPSLYMWSVHSFSASLKDVHKEIFGRLSETYLEAGFLSWRIYPLKNLIATSEWPSQLSFQFVHLHLCKKLPVSPPSLAIVGSIYLFYLPAWWVERTIFWCFYLTSIRVKLSIFLYPYWSLVCLILWVAFCLLFFRTIHLFIIDL